MSQEIARHLTICPKRSSCSEETKLINHMSLCLNYHENSIPKFLQAVHLGRFLKLIL